MDNITANLLFADGAASALVCSDKVASEKNLKGLTITSYYSEVNFGGKKDMAWTLSSTGFLMTLSNYIPELVEKSIKNLVNQTLSPAAKKVSDIVHWAVHPGGKRILDAIAKELEFQNGELQSAYSVLENYGNMSSPTVLYVLKDILDNKLDHNNEELIFSAGFGPGLTMESMILSTR
ncbi:Alpha-pyrone synthesis polyketide synthase-like Pks11 [compost metagenome]